MTSRTLARPLGLAVAVVCLLCSISSGQIQFRRGDIDGSGQFDAVTDASFLSDALFAGGAAPPCLDAADVNDDGLLDLVDIQAVLTAGLIPGSSPVPAPFPGCGFDPTFDGLGCLSYDNCNDFIPTPEDSNYVLAIGALNGEPGETDSTTVTFDNNGMPLVGWSFGVCHDPTFVEILDVDPGETTDNLDADFETTAIYPGEGWVAGSLLSLTSSLTLPPGNGYEMYEAEYALLAEGSTTLEFCETLGDPPVRIRFRRAGQTMSIAPESLDGQSTIVDNPSGPGTFRRGDANTDASTDVGDVIFIINWIFQSGPNPTCRKAADANDDGTIDLGDPIWLINYIFVDGPLPETPFPGCGTDPTSDPLNCVNYPHCG